MFGIIIAIVVTLVLSQVGYTVLQRNEKKRNAELIFDIMENMLLNNSIKDCSVVIENIMGEKGLKYTIYLFGRIYKALDIYKEENKEAGNIQAAIGQFLKAAMAEDIVQYSRKRKEQEAKIKKVAGKGEAT